MKKFAHIFAPALIFAGSCNAETCVHTIKPLHDPWLPLWKEDPVTLYRRLLQAYLHLEEVEMHALWIEDSPEKDEIRHHLSTARHFLGFDVWDYNAELY